MRAHAHPPGLLPPRFDFTLVWPRRERERDASSGVNGAAASAAARDARIATVVVSVLVAVGGACGEPRPPVIEGEGGRWELLPPLARGARQEIAVVALRDEVVVLGGFSSLGAVVTLVEAYHPASEQWRVLAEVPTPMHHANVAVVNDQIVLAGFLVGADFAPDGRVFIYDADADTWREGAPMTDGAQRGACGVAVDGTAVFLFGGVAGGSSARVSRYDVASDAWSELDDMPTALDHLGAATLGDRIFVIGGRSNGIGNHTASVLSFDPSSGAFDEGERAPMPTGRAGFALAVVGSEILVVGGEGNADTDNGVFAQTQAYDPAADSWRDLIAMRTPRHGMGASTIDGALYVPGGADRQQFAAVDVFERFVPASE